MVPALGAGRGEDRPGGPGGSVERVQHRHLDHLRPGDTAYVVRLRSGVLLLQGSQVVQRLVPIARGDESGHAAPLGWTSVSTQFTNVSRPTGVVIPFDAMIGLRDAGGYPIFRWGTARFMPMPIMLDPGHRLDLYIR